MPEMRVKGGIGVKALIEDGVTGEMRVMGKEGDLRVTWNSRDTDEVAAARAQFDDLRGKRFLAFRVTGDGGKGEQITEFDADAQKLILAPPMAGG